MIKFRPLSLSRLAAMWRRLAADRRGGPAIEFAIIAPVLLVCLTFTFDLGYALQVRSRLAEAVRAGGLYAMSYPTDTNGDVNSTAISTVITNAVPDWSNVTVTTPVMACYCTDPSTGTATPTTCSSATSTTCTGSTELRRFITLSATRPLAPIMVTNLSSVSYSHVVRFQ